MLLGKLAPVDVSDGSGMNLMDIHSHKWIPSILEHCGGKDLQEKLKCEPVEGGTNLGRISPYFVARYGFSPGMTITTIDTIQIRIIINVVSYLFYLFQTALLPHLPVTTRPRLFL
jgi:xylulokinase